jgi:hypothetical protein
MIDVNPRGSVTGLAGRVKHRDQSVTFDPPL